jgi:hypothetical protein
MAENLGDPDLLRQASGELATLARWLDVDSHLQKWATEADAISGGIVADALDQAKGLLDELAEGRARTLADAIERITATLPPPLE